MPSSFTHASGSVTFSRPPLRPQRSLELLQAEAQSAGGDFFGLDSYDVEKLIVLRWPGMSTSDLEDLEAFLFDTVNGMAETFTYTDVWAGAHSVRFAAAELRSIERAADRHDVTVLLMEA